MNVPTLLFAVDCFRANEPINLFVMKYLFVSFIVLSLFSCNKELQGCMHEWASNYDQEAEIDCCCEYDIAAVVQDVKGSYNFQDICQSVSYNYKTNISIASAAEGEITIKNFSIYRQKLTGIFNDGVFEIEKNYTTGGCNFEFRGTLEKENGNLILKSDNQVINGLCTNITDLTCVATSD